VVKHGLKYKAQIRYNGKMMYIGLYCTKLEAAENFDACARKIGKSKNLNFPDKTNYSHVSLPQWL